MLKLVLTILICLAFSFIKIANCSSVPDIPSAKTIEASTPETTITPLSKSSIETLSPGTKNMVDSPDLVAFRAFLETVN